MKWNKKKRHCGNSVVCNHRTRTKAARIATKRAHHPAKKQCYWQHGIIHVFNSFGIIFFAFRICLLHIIFGFGLLSLPHSLSLIGCLFSFVKSIEKKYSVAAKQCMCNIVCVGRLIQSVFSVQKFCVWTIRRKEKNPSPLNCVMRAHILLQNLLFTFIASSSSSWQRYCCNNSFHFIYHKSKKQRGKMCFLHNFTTHSLVLFMSLEISIQVLFHQFHL